MEPPVGEYRLGDTRPGGAARMTGAGGGLWLRSWCYRQTRQGLAGGEVGAFGVTVDLLSCQEPDDRDSGVARSAPAGGEGSLSLSRWNRRVPARHDTVLLSDLVLDLDVQAGMGAAVA
jgi:hypothetical protein